MIAYAVDRAENGTVHRASQALPVKYMSGVSDNIIPLWTDVSVPTPMTTTSTKPRSSLRAWASPRMADGVWVTDRGDVMEYELIAPAEFAGLVRCCGEPG